MIFDYSIFKNMVDIKKENYLSQHPYPYAYFDGLFDDSLLESINQEIEEQSFALDERTIDNIEVKVRSDFEDNESVPESISQFFSVINGGRFLSIVTSLTGIEGLISDPYFDGGGVNIIGDGGTLAVHVDGTTQHRMKLCRRINAILFLNDFWDPAWNGFHEQWSYLDKSLDPFDKNQKWKCVRKILPKKNRLLIFTTNDLSWHGHAGPLSVPSDVKRRSLISYYYTTQRPNNDLKFGDSHRALFIDNQITVSDEAYSETEIIL